MSGGEPRASIVVPTWNRSDFLTTCLESLVAQEYPREAFEVVVVDDGSTDDTAAVVARHASPEGPAVRHVPQLHGGVNRARNRGVEAARGEYVFFIDDDEIAPPGYLGLACGLLERHPEVDGVGGPCLDAPDNAHRTCANCSLGAVRRVPAPDGSVRALLGGNMGVRRAAFTRVGLFDPTLSGRGDDSEWFSRGGLKLLYDDSIYVWHRKDQSFRELLRTYFRQGRALPHRYARGGVAYRPRPGRIARQLAHAVGRRCTKGALLAARELGATAEWLVRGPARR